MLNNEDIIKLKSILATKEDLENIATKEDLENIKTEVDIIAKTTAHILENMATKKDILDVKTEIHDIRMDLKSFKKDTDNSIKEIKNDAVDLIDTVMHQDKRIEKLENKVFA
jgi:hypothetical protein